MSDLTIWSRASWGAKPPKQATYRWLGKRDIIVHWMASPDDAWALANGGYAAALRRVQEVHFNRGALDILYNHAVSQDGRVWQCRGFTYRGGANGTSTSNGYDISIGAILGPGEVPSEAMLASLGQYVLLAKDRGWDGDVKGHRDIVARSCPGPDLYQWVQDEGWNEGDDMPTHPNAALAAAMKRAGFFPGESTDPDVFGQRWSQEPESNWARFWEVATENAPDVTGGSPCSPATLEAADAAKAYQIALERIRGL